MAVRYGSIGVATTRTVPPAPVAAGGAGTGPEGWTNVDLTVTGGTPVGFHPMRTGGDLSGWDFSNPSAGVLRLKVARVGDGGAWDRQTQTGAVLMGPVQIVPRTFTNPTGVVGNKWRSEDCRLYIEMEVTPADARFSNDGSGTGAPNGVGFYAGPIIGGYVTDHGTGAAFVTADPAPPFTSYTTIYTKKENHKDNDTYRNTFSLGNVSNGDLYNAPDSADGNHVHGTNTLGLTVGGRYASTNPAPWGQGRRSVGAVASDFLNTAEDGTLNEWFEFVNHFNDRNSIEGLYVYVGICLGQWVTGTNAEGTYIDVLKFRYRVQPTKTTASRSA